MPFVAQRIVNRYEFEKKTENPNYLNALSRSPIEYYHMFYNDTAVYGNTPALMCGYAFFGAEHLLFGTDAPLTVFPISETIKSIEDMDIPASDKQKIFEDNARRVLCLTP